MANRILKPNMGRTIWTPDQKPPYGARINPKHPLAQGLVGAWLLNEGGGSKAFDSVLPTFSLDLNQYSAYWTRDGIACLSSYIGVYATTPTYLRLNSPLSISVGALHYGLPTSNAGLGGVTYNSDGNTSPYVAFYIMFTSNSYRYTFNNGSFQQFYSDTVDLTKGFHQAALVIKNNSQQGYADGKKQNNSLTVPITTISYDATSRLGVGDFLQNERNANFISKYMYIWNRSLSDAEIVSLHADPYQMFEWPVQDFLVGEISAEDFSGWSDLIKNTLKLDYGASTYAGDQLRKTGKYSVGSFPSVGAATKKTTKTFEGVWSSIADLIAQLVGAAQKFYQDCISVLTPAGIILKKSTHSFIGDLTSIGTMVRKGIKSLAGTSTFIGDITRFIGKKIIRTFSTLGELLAQKSGIIYQVCLAGLTFSAKSIKSSSTKLSGAIQTIGILIKKSLPKSLSGFLNSSAKIIKMPIKLATSSASFVGTISKFIYKKILRTFTTIGEILTQKTGAIYKSLAAGMTFSGRVIKSYSMKLSGVFQDLGAIIKKPLKTIKGGFSTVASVARLRGRILTAILSSSGAIYKKTFKGLLSNLESTGNIIRFIYFSIGAIKSFIGDLLTRVFRTIIGILHHRTYFVPFMDREILLPTDGRTYVVEKDDNTYEINE